MVGFLIELAAVIANSNIPPRKVSLPSLGIRGDELAPGTKNSILKQAGLK
jgi:hypothetical protein